MSRPGHKRILFCWKIARLAVLEMGHPILVANSALKDPSFKELEWWRPILFCCRMMVMQQMWIYKMKGACTWFHGAAQSRRGLTRPSSPFRDRIQNSTYHPSLLLGCLVIKILVYCTRRTLVNTKTVIFVSRAIRRRWRKRPKLLRIWLLSRPSFCFNHRKTPISGKPCFQSQTQPTNWRTRSELKKNWRKTTPPLPRPQSRGRPSKAPIKNRAGQI